MTPRSIRRAAERKLRKLERKKERALELEAQAQPIPVAEPDTSDPPNCGHDEYAETSAAQLSANRANAQLSTGPRTAEGKAISSLNAVKTGLTGRTVLLPSDDAAEYERHIRDYEEAFQPIGVLERDLVQSIADTVWRLRRIPGLEMAIHAQGQLEFADAFDDHDPSLRASMIELRTEMKYEKQIRNLQLQDTRLFRRKEKEMAELRRLQQERKAQEAEAADTAANQQAAAKQSAKPSARVENGFEFSSVNPDTSAITFHPEPPAESASRAA